MTLRQSYRGTCAVAAIVAVTGCASASSSDATSAPQPRQPLVSHGMVPLASSVELEPHEHPAVEVRIDQLLASPVLNDDEFRAAVDSWIVYWEKTAAGAVPDFLGRMGSFGEMVDSALLAADLPPSLRYLPFIESGYNPRATSRASAVGMWQFMSATAAGLGMEVSPLLDERRDPERSTEAAIAFLSELREGFGSWFIALAAYNSGPNGTRRVLDRYAPGVPPSDSLFWALRSHFPRETRDFVPKLFGAVVVAASPDLYGHEAAPHAPFVFDQVSVPDATTLDVIARAAAVPQADIERLNPQYLRGITPRGRESLVRVPQGRGPAFLAAYALIPADERVTFVEHRVASGETLSHIALRYGIRVSDLQAANPSVRPRYLRVGALLTVPVAPSVRNAAHTGA
ncbi:MAG: LysM peptidoglycan-binding domain-containing protein [Gemmatimonadetes bacterium]|nr:LysM peptidoglycan-binding domain-containing protein [Gemmatimonadota bacterium]